MKKIIIAIIGLASLSSCRLDLQPESSLVYDTYWKNEDAVKSAQRGVYTTYRAYASTFWTLGELRSDMWGGKVLNTEYSIDFIRNRISTQQPGITNWGALYGLLHYINDVITSAPSVPVENATSRNHIMGQMHGLRAYVYFTLLKAWGDVPLNTIPLTKVVDVTELKKERAPKAEVANQIKEDIAKSLEYFGSDGSLWENENVFWSKAATLALKGEAYIFFGTVLGEGASSYTEAKNALSQVEGLGFSLQPSYANLWGTANESRARNREFIFAIDYRINQGSNFLLDVTSALTKDVGSYYDRQGNSMRTWVSSGLSSYGASPKILEMFGNEPNDTRGNATFMHIYADNNGGAGYPNYNEAAHRATILSKFGGEIIDSRRQSFENYPIYRFADVLLLLAEAKNLLGEDPSSEINRVRQRAYGANYSSAVAYTNGSREANTKAILDERFKEFVAEGKRWWDLQRAGVNWIKREVPTFNQDPINGDERKVYLPLSPAMLQDDPNMKQTEGYPNN